MAEVERILKDTPGSVSQQWYEDGAAVDPGTVTVNVTRADGTALITGGSVSGAGTAARTFSLTTTHTALLDNLRISWVSSAKGTLVSYVEVVGGFLFSLADARALKPLDNATAYPTAALAAMRISVEQAIEDACSLAFVPRYERQTMIGDGSRTLSGLRWKKVRTVRAASATYAATTTTLSATDLGALTWDDGGLYGYTWRCGYPWTVGYEHGLDRTPDRIRRAALLLAKSWLVSGPVDDRASTFSSIDGGTYGLVVPGRGGSIFGLPEVDAAVQQYSRTVLVA